MTSTLRALGMYKNICRLNIGGQCVKKISEICQSNRNYHSLHHKHVIPIKYLSGASNTQYYSTTQETSSPSSAEEAQLPKMKFSTYIDVNLFRIKDFKPMKYNDYEFTVCLEEYVQVYVKTVGDRHMADSKPDSLYAAAAYFGPNHPLNFSMRVKTRPEGDLKAAIHAIESLLKIGINKICINTTEVVLVSKIRRLAAFKEQNYIKPQNGQRYKMADTLKQIDKLLRDNNDVQFMWKFSPDKCFIQGVFYAADLAKSVFETKL